MRSAVAVLTAWFALGVASAHADARALARSIASVSVTREDVVLVGAGDIARCGDIEPARATARLVSAVIAAFPGAIVFTAGDTVYGSSTTEHLRDCYGPTWGVFKDRTLPVPGNHDYHGDGARSYFDYFDVYRRDQAARRRGYYSVDIGRWHIVALNSNIDVGPRSAQVAWLADDLRSTRMPCLLAIWHHPLISSGRHGKSANDRGRLTRPFWDVLVRHRADVVVNGHDHLYERFLPQLPDGTPSADGVLQITAGTGGAPLYDIVQIQKNSSLRDNRHWGVLLLTLHPDSYDWAFLATDGVIYDRSAKPVACRGRNS